MEPACSRLFCPLASVWPTIIFQRMPESRLLMLYLLRRTHDNDNQTPISSLTFKKCIQVDQHSSSQYPSYCENKQRTSHQQLSKPPSPPLQPPRCSASTSQAFRLPATLTALRCGYSPSCWPSSFWPLVLCSSLSSLVFGTGFRSGSY